MTIRRRTERGVRDYIHVVDLAKGHVAALDYARKHTGTEVFNLGTGRGYSVKELVKTFEEVNGVKISYVIAPLNCQDICYNSRNTLLPFDPDF